MKKFAPLLTLFLCLLPLLYIQPQIRLNGDPVFLTLGADAILSGKTMVDAFYDTNPPLCFLIYIPAALLMHAGLPLWWVFTVYVGLLVMLGAFLVNALLKSWPGLDAPRRWGLLAAYVAGATFPAQYEFCQKDQLIAVGLLPFLLAQVTLALQPQAPKKIFQAALVFGTPFILVKPHYGLLPVLLMVWRAWRGKKLPDLFRFDFAVLAVSVTAYIAVVVLRFPDFISPILHDSVHIYASSVHSDVYKAAGGMALMGAALVVFALCAGDESPEAKRLAVLLSAGALVAVIPFFAQLKGFSYQMLPVISLLVPAVFMTASLYIPRLAARPAALAVLLLFAGIYVVFPPAFGFPRHADYKASPLAKLIDEKAKGSAFFMESTFSYLINPMAIYTGVPYASRFQSLWFMENLAAARDRGAYSCKDSGDNPCHRFARYVAEDLAKYRPALVLLFDDPVPQLDMLSIFAGDKDFIREWSHYRRDGNFTLKYRDYSNGRFKIDRLVVDYDFWVRD